MKVIKKIIKFIFLLILLVILGVLIYILPKVIEYSNWAYDTIDESSSSDFRIATTTKIYDSDNNLIAQLTNSGYLNYLSYDNIPEDVINAFVAVEDQTYWDNDGIDIKGIARVIYKYITTGGTEEHGASTITQQLMRNIYLSSEVSLERKSKEILLALAATKKYTKEEIMEYYVNNICFANAYYGIEAASEGYFGKSIDECSLSEIAYLCAIPNSPEYYNPYKYPERALTRRDKILGDMLEQGYITQSDYYTAINEEITIIEKNTYSSTNSYQVSYAINCATEYLMYYVENFNFQYSFDTQSDYLEYQEEYDSVYEECKNLLYTNSYTIYTTLDSDIQTTLQEKLDEGLSFDTEVDEDGQYLLQGAITSIDNSTGKVVAIVGGRTNEDGTTSYLNRAYQSYRQPGSSIKPLIVYTPALQQGYTPTSTVMNISVSSAKKKKMSEIAAMTGTTMTMRSALEQSKNGVAYKLFATFGADYCMRFLEKMRFSHICPDDYTISASLGGLTYGVSTVEMANAYNTLYNEGVYTKTDCIDKIYNSNGANIYNSYDSVTVYGDYACDEMIDMMTGVLTNGTAKKLNWYSYTDNVAACKTGTTNNSKDGWLCGFTPQYTVTVWVGYDTPKELSSLYGATYPGQIWRDSMLALIEDTETVTEFTYNSGYDPVEQAKKAAEEAAEEAASEEITITTIDPNTGIVSQEIIDDYQENDDFDDDDDNDQPPQDVPFQP